MFQHDFLDLTPMQIGTAIRAFMSETCPVCEGEKGKPVDPFCATCLGRLPAEIKAKVSDRRHFIAVFQSASEYLSR